MQINGVKLQDIPKEDLLKILAASTNAGSPFTAEEIAAVRDEIGCVRDDAKPPSPKLAPPPSKRGAAKPAPAPVEVEEDEEDEDEKDD